MSGEHGHTGYAPASHMHQDVNEALANLDARVDALEGGTTPPEPPAGGKPWDVARVAFAKNIVVADHFERVSSAESLRDALRSGTSVELTERQRLGGYSFEIADGASLIAQGDGATVYGNGGDPIIRPKGEGLAYNILFEGRNTGDTGEDGARPLTGSSFWLDKCALRMTHDEEIDLWDPGQKRLTVTRSALCADDDREFGALLGSKDDVPIDAWLVLWRTYIETGSRQPLSASPGAVAHLVNTVHAYWWAGAPEPVETADGGVVMLDGPIFGRPNTGSGIGTAVLRPPGGIYIHDPMRLYPNVALKTSTGVPCPELPYDPMPWAYAEGAAVKNLAMALANDAGPAIAVKKRLSIISEAPAAHRIGRRELEQLGIGKR